MEKGLKAHFARVPIGLRDAQNLHREVTVTASCGHPGSGDKGQVSSSGFSCSSGFLQLELTKLL